MPLEDRADPEAGRKLLSPRRNGRGPPTVQHAVDDEDDDFQTGYQAPDTRQGERVLWGIMRCSVHGECCAAPESLLVQLWPCPCVPERHP